jgi:hypothetical protein
LTRLRRDIEQQDDRAEHETAEHRERERSSAQPRVPSRQARPCFADPARGNAAADLSHRMI